MNPLFKIFTLSRKIAKSLLKDQIPESLNNSDIFNETDKIHILKNLTDPSLIKERINLANTIDKNEDWKPLKNKITNRKVNFLPYYSVAATLVVLLGIRFYFKNNFNEEIPTSKTIVNNIKIGSDKAILTLEDGTQIALQKNSELQRDNLNCNGEKLIYSKSDKTGYNYLTVPRGGQFYLQLTDNTKIWLNSETKIKYPINFIDGQLRTVELVYGEAYFDVSPSTKHKGSLFKVMNKNQEIKVLGTEFNVKAYTDDFSLYTTLVEGKVELNINNKKQALIPNQQLIYNLSTNAVSLAYVDVYNEISWKDGVFSFENKSLKEIMKVLSRWYDIQVVFVNKEIENDEFVGVLSKNQNIEEILMVIKNFGVIKNYQINDKTIVLK